MNVAQTGSLLYRGWAIRSLQNLSYALGCDLS
ncbi:MAG: hypothetical protein JWO95_353 [Verrucomicrobiales bacterium]|nr:hypothetical protein [Verrucomicrobiales bacterium]